MFRSFTPNEYISEGFLEQFHRHSQLSARIAAGIAQKTQVSPAVVLAALLHDVGKLVIAERTPAHLERGLAQSEEEGRPLFEVEERLTHISHAEVGAYLLRLWGLPYAVVEVVARHHHPRRIRANGYDMVLLVCVTNLFAHELAPDTATAAAAMDMDLLREAGVAGYLPEWRRIADAAQTQTQPV